MVKFWKIQIFSKISILSFFSAPVANFVTIFNLDKVYRRTIPFAWHYFRCFYFAEMTWNRNLNVENIFKFQFQNLSFIEMSPTLRRTISSDTVLLFKSRWDILLFESLSTINYSNSIAFSAKPSNFYRIWSKIKFFLFFTFFQKSANLCSGFRPRNNA